MQQTQTKHTPGPWFYPGTGNFIGGPDRIRVADAGGIERLPEVRQANARLIAAAPDLLAALQQIAMLNSGDRTEDARIIARAAIRKATGEEE